jgi:predicted CXXCH cytochrome family protein
MTRLLACALVAGAVLVAAAGTEAAHSTLGCADCHISHTPGMSVGPLWSTRHTADGLPTFTLYSSPSFDALQTDISRPDGASKLCLGCHDGTYSGLDSNGPGIFKAGDLARSHPVSFTYDTALAARVPGGRLHDPNVTSSGLGGTIAKDLLDQNGKLQCTSCHDPHLKTAKGPKLLRYEYAPGSRSGERICVVCHNM